MNKAQIDQHLGAIDRDGYTILLDVIDRDLVGRILTRVREIEETTLPEKGRRNGKRPQAGRNR